MTDRHSVRARARARALLGLGLALGVVLIAATACSQPSSGPRGSAGPPTPTGSVSSATATPPQPPRAGAWLGAWAQPTTWTTQGRLAAVTRLEQQLGRPLDLVHTYHLFDAPFPSDAEAQWLAEGRRLLISWAGADTAAIAAGDFDDQIRAQADQLRDLDQPVLLRWRWEMNRPNLQGEVHDPQTYVAAWRRIHTIFGQEGATNVGWVWCPLARDFIAGDGPAYYPGDDQVDWLCADVYAGPQNRSFRAVAAPFRAWAKATAPNRPIMIGELGTQYAAPADRPPWWTDAIDTIAGWPQVRAVVLFDSRGNFEEPFDLSISADPALQATLRNLVSGPPFAPSSSKGGATG